MPPFPQAEAEAAVAASFEKPVASVYASFGPSIAAASIAQVHKATVATAAEPRAVAVKVLRPGIEQRFHVDLTAFAYAAQRAENLSAEARRLRLIEIVETLRRSVMVEMDFRLEAAALSEMAENTKDDPDFRVPTIDWDRTTKEVLTLEWIDGIPLTDRARLQAKGFDLPKLGRGLIQSFLRHALRDGFFHADMHPGNLFVDNDGHIVAVDFGIMGRLGAKERLFLAEILHGFITRDYHRTAEVHFEAGYVPPHHSIEDFAQAIRAIGEPIQIAPPKIFRWRNCDAVVRGDRPVRHAHAAGITAAAEDHGGGRRRGALARSQTRYVEHGEPVVREWMTRNLGPAGKLENVAQGAADTGRFVGNAPGLLTHGLRVLGQLDEMTRDGLVLSPQTIARSANPSEGGAIGPRSRYGSLQRCWR